MTPPLGTTWRAVVAAALGTSLLAGGCGGSTKPLTRAQLLSKADATCRRINSELSAVNAKSSESSAHAISVLVSYEQKGLAELSKLIPPASMASDWKAILAGAQTVANDTLKLLERVNVEKDPKAVHSLLVETSKVQEHVLAITQRDGFKDCAQLA
jgi:hypothetical protein